MSKYNEIPVALWVTGISFFLYTNRYLYGINGRFLHKKKNVWGKFLCDEKSVLERIAKCLPIYLVLTMSVLIQKKEL